MAGIMKRKFHLTKFYLAVLLVVLVVALGMGMEKKNPLFDRGRTTTLYGQTLVGVKPNLDPAKYFPGEKLDYGKITFNLEGCDWNKPGEYQIPVLYDGKKTNATLRIKVLPDGPGDGQGESGSYFFSP